MSGLPWMLAFALVTTLGGCSSGSEPTRSFNVCVHAQDAPFIPGSTGDECTVTQQMRAGQTRTIDVEADKLSGENRTATLAIEFVPNNWTATLGGTTVPVPGKQSLTLVVPSGTNPGNYRVAIRATSNGEVVIASFTVTVVNPV